MADTKIEIDLDYKGLEQCLEEIGRDFQGEGYGLERLLERYPFLPQSREWSWLREWKP